MRQPSKSPLPGGEGQGEGSTDGPAEFRAVLKKRARELRHHQTEAEAQLWFLLRKRGLSGAKFRRQVPFEPYILDFYCHEASLV
jgi:very-short-patch-repair endonuclease